MANAAGDTSRKGYCKFQRGNRIRRVADHIFGYLEVEEIGLQVAADNAAYHDTTPPKRPATGKDGEKKEALNRGLSEKIGFALHARGYGASSPIYALVLGVIPSRGN